MIQLAPLVGVLQPGEETTRAYPVTLDEQTVAVLQKGMGDGAAGLQILEQTTAHMKLVNRGKSFAPYMILFMSEKQLRALLASRELLTQIFGAVKEHRKRGKK